MKRMLAALAACLLLSGINPLSFAASADAALALAKDTSARVQEILRENRSRLEQEPSAIYDLVDEMILPHFDFRTISRWVLGKHWRKANAAQRERFAEEFQNLLVRTYAKALLEYSDAELRFLPVNQSSEDDVTVRSEVVPGSGPAIPINYAMHHKEGVWKVYDVSVDGISLVTNYRGSLGDQIGKEGLDAIIDKISARNRSGN